MLVNSSYGKSLYRNHVNMASLKQYLYGKEQWLQWSDYDLIKRHQNKRVILERKCISFRNSNGTHHSKLIFLPFPYHQLLFHRKKGWKRRQGIKILFNATKYYYCFIIYTASNTQIHIPEIFLGSHYCFSARITNECSRHHAQYFLHSHEFQAS